MSKIKLAKSFDFFTVYTLERYKTVGTFLGRISSRKLGEITINHLW